MSDIRLDRYLADVHIGTRKEIRALIHEGFVKVDGDVVTKADTHVDTETAKVSCKGVALTYSKFRYLMLYKPAGVVTATKDGFSKPVVQLLKNIPIRGLNPVGRLDKDTEGLLLLTDDGQFLHRLISPQSHVDKEYEVHVKTPVSDDDLQRLCDGVDIGDEAKTMPARAERIGTDENGCEIIRLIIQEGRFHQVKRMLHAVGNEVVFLKRVSMGGVFLDPKLRPGAFRNLSSDEIKLLKGEDVS